MNLIQQGPVKLRAQSAEIGMAKNGPQIAVNFEIVDGPDSGRTIVWRDNLTGSYSGGCLRAMRSIGYVSHDIAAACREILDGGIVEGEIQHKPGAPGRPEWAKLVFGSAPVLAALTPAEIKKINDELVPF